VPHDAATNLHTFLIIDSVVLDLTPGVGPAGCFGVLHRAMTAVRNAGWRLADRPAILAFLTAP